MQDRGFPAQYLLPDVPGLPDQCQSLGQVADLELELAQEIHGPGSPGMLVARRSPVNLQGLADQRQGFGKPPRPFEHPGEVHLGDRIIGMVPAERPPLDFQDLPVQFLGLGELAGVLAYARQSLQGVHVGCVVGTCRAIPDLCRQTEQGLRPVIAPMST